MRAASKQERLEVGGCGNEFLRERQGFFVHGFEAFAAVADFQHGHAAALEVEQFSLGGFEDGKRQGAGAGGEVEDAVGHGCLSWGFGDGSMFATVYFIAARAVGLGVGSAIL